MSTSARLCESDNYFEKSFICLFGFGVALEFELRVSGLRSRHSYCLSCSASLLFFLDHAVCSHTKG
jgi:hypothetical protein